MDGLFPSSLLHVYKNKYINTTYWVHIALLVGICFSDRPLRDWLYWLYLGDSFLRKANSLSLSSPQVPAAFHLGVVPVIFPPSILLCQLMFKQFLMNVWVHVKITNGARSCVSLHCRMESVPTVSIAFHFPCPSFVTRRELEGGSFSGCLLLK